MAVVKATETFTDRAGSRTFQGDDYVRSFVVVTDDILDDAVVVRDAVTIPRLNDGYPTHLSAWAKSVDARQRLDSPFVWDVLVEYTTDPGSGWTFPVDPLSELPVVAWSTAAGTEEFQVSMDGENIVNSADIPFDPAPSRRTTYPVCHVTRNEAILSTGWLRWGVPSLNEDEWLGLAPLQVMLAAMTAEYIKHGVGGYWKVGYEFWFRADEDNFGWERPILDAGYMEWRPVPTPENPNPDPQDPNVEWDHFPIMVKQQQKLRRPGPGGMEYELVDVPTTEPFLLDGHGRKATHLQIHGNPKARPPILPEIVWAHYRRYRHVLFAPLGLESVILTGEIPRPPRPPSRPGPPDRSLG